MPTAATANSPMLPIIIVSTIPAVVDRRFCSATGNAMAIISFRKDGHVIFSFDIITPLQHLCLTFTNTDNAVLIIAWPAYIIYGELCSFYSDSRFPYWTSFMPP